MDNTETEDELITLGLWVIVNKAGIGDLLAHKIVRLEAVSYTHLQVQKLSDGGMKTKEAIKRVAQEMNGSKNELYDAYHKHI